MVNQYIVGEFNNNTYFIHQFGTIISDNIKDRKTAEFICRACNNHNALLEACETAIAVHHDFPKPPLSWTCTCNICRPLGAAIDKAKEKK